MNKNSFDVDYEMRVLAVMNRFLRVQLKSDSTQRVINILSHFKSTRAVDMSRVFYAFRKSSDVSVVFSSSFCSVRVAQITRALCFQNSDKSYTLASRDVITARKDAQVARVYHMLANECARAHNVFDACDSRITSVTRESLEAYAHEASTRLLRFKRTL